MSPSRLGCVDRPLLKARKKCDIGRYLKSNFLALLENQGIHVAGLLLLFFMLKQLVYCIANHRYMPYLDSFLSPLVDADRAYGAVFSGA